MESTVNKGTTYIVLPPSTQAHRIRILVVDQDESVLKLALRLLTVEGYEVDTAKDPVLALEKTKKTNYDILLADVRFPKMEVLVLAESTRQTNPHISILFMAEPAILETAKQSVKMGGCDLITKPLDPKKLLQTVKKALSHKLEDTRIASAKELGYLAQLEDVILKTGDKKSISKISLGFALSCVSAESGIFFYRSKDSKSLLLTFGSILQEKKFEVFEVPLDNNLAWPSKDPKEIIQSSQPEKLPVLPYLLEQQSTLPWINHFCEPNTAFLYIPVTFTQTDMSAMVIRLRPWTNEIKDYEKNLLYLDARFTALSLANLDLLNASKLAHKETQYLHEQNIELERLTCKQVAVAEVSYELNNLISSILAQLNFLEKELNSQKPDLARKHLAMTKETIKSTNFFSKSLELEKRAPSVKEPCHFNSILEEIVSYAQIQSKFNNLEIVKSLEPDLPKIDGDITQIKQLFYNLLNNAADAMGKRKGEGGKIFLKTKFDAEGKFIQVEVEDTGIGISPEILPYIFQKPIPTKSGAYGFDLLITKRIVDQHGGTIEIDSKPSQGTVVRLKFPFQKEP
ncbi:MAG: signal transduction histidine kinase, nitrogen specific, NtrB [candidate division Zixibacteria bacterium RBG-1]|nr:MAG: signal transduction histidine kinase, nitrogen specific, NtrB [candidate division Zixibacteria bacterium RBG-1]OGC86705.1 MAG: hypothetical protein A2V73_06090 [candidate division Zixibacteria bacterium RBG_19FT_COMBO_42_43]